ncbi:MAG: hypothetical protein KIS96_14410 [Bauldia sp.]|nr:hypothetical protein [Bauldia sp.]
MNTDAFPLRDTLADLADWPVIDVRDFPLRYVRGNTLRGGGLMDAHTSALSVYVSPDGRCWDAMYGIEMTAERWGDFDYLGPHFCADRGEFERCGIKFALCGSAAV